MDWQVSSRKKGVWGAERWTEKQKRSLETRKES